MEVTILQFMVVLSTALRTQLTSLEVYFCIFGGPGKYVFVTLHVKAVVVCLLCSTL